MGIGGSLRELAAFIDACEADGQVSAVELGAIEPTDDGRLTADVAVEFSLQPDLGDVEHTDTALGDDGRLRLAFETVAPAIPTTAHDVTVDPSTTTVTPDGTATVTLTASIPTGAETDDRGDRSAAVTAAGDDENGSNARARSDAPDAPEASAGATAGSAPASGQTSSRLRSGSTGADDGAPRESVGRSAGDVPPFEDRELLQQVYDEHDTFAEMPAALGMDVTAETVRRYMIDFGIHEPRSYDTAPPGDADGERADDAVDEIDEIDEIDEVGDAGETEAETVEAEDGANDAEDGTVDETEDDEEAPVVLADGIGLPEETTVDTIVETVRESNTIYEVTRDIGVDREAALELLRELDLLEFVVGRLATEAERTISRETVVDRLRQHADAQ